MEIEQLVKEQAKAQGFDLVRIASAEEFIDDRDAALERVRAGHMDGLPWFTESRVRRGADPQTLLPGARSIICLGLSYIPGEDSRFRGNDGGKSGNDGGGRRNDGQVDGALEPPPLISGKVARYARLRDYHRVMKRRMRALVRELSDSLEKQVSARWYVDDGPMLDRAAANRAGLGWFGKNTNILTPSHGSWVFLGQVITDLGLAPDPPLQKTCGSCVRCIDACPTGAIVAPYVIDNSRCISYLTIENRGPIPRELRPQMLDWVFGCDICQEVCPVNRKASTGDPSVWERAGESLQRRDPQDTGGGTDDGPSLARNGGLGQVDLVGLLSMSEEDFRERFRGTPIMRAKRDGMRRNACVALGNLAAPESVPALRDALETGSVLVRSHAAWALGRIDTPDARRALENAAAEPDQVVAEEIEAALTQMLSPG